MRALNDNINRTIGSRHKHIDTDTVYQLWTANAFKRALLDVMKESQNVAFGWKRAIGLEADPAMFTDFSIALARLLTEQPKREVLCTTLTQETSYVKVKPVKMAPRRYFRLPTYTVGTGLVLQEVLMRQQVRSVRILLGDGNTMNEQFCHAIFGNNTELGPILPMGKDTINSERIFTLFNAKSSDLVTDGGWINRLINAKLNYLLEHFHRAQLFPLVELVPTLCYFRRWHDKIVHS